MLKRGLQLIAWAEARRELRVKRSGLPLIGRIESAAGGDNSLWGLPGKPRQHRIRHRSPNKLKKVCDTLIEGKPDWCMMLPAATQSAMLSKSAA